jgi:dedicator of cytokinesis protein 3
MILTEWFLRNNFDEVESQIVTCLDVILMQQGDGDDMTRSFFVASLRELFSKGDVDADLRDRALGFLDLVDHFLDLLLALVRLW